MKQKRGFVPVLIIILISLVLVAAFFVGGKFEKLISLKSGGRIVIATPTPYIYPDPTAKPLVNPYQGNKQIENQIRTDLALGNLELKIINIIDNYAFIEEHSPPPGGGGGWSIIKKENGKWVVVGNSADALWCSIYQNSEIPRGLIGECD